MTGEFRFRNRSTTEDLVNEIARSLAVWWHTRAETDTELLWDAYEALEYLYPDEADK